MPQTRATRGTALAGNRVNQPRETAARLGVSMSMLRKLTTAGEIGHVRLGIGPQRQRIGYTDAQIEEFIAGRTIPAAPHTTGMLPPVRPRMRRRATPPDTSDQAMSSLLNLALANGSVTEWGHSRG